MKKVLLILLVLLLTGCSNKSDETVNVLNWTSYIPDSVIHDFEREYNIKVNYGTYSSNEELLAKLSSSKKKTYDVVFPSDYMVDLMIKKDMLTSIDINKLSNYSNINPKFLHQEYDYNNSYSLPFLLATTTIAVNRRKISDPISGYNDLLRDEYKNNIALLDDQRIVIGMGLLANNYDMNDTSDISLESSYDYLMKLKENVKAFDSDSPKNFLITDEVDIAFLWNAEAILAKVENNDIEIIYPSDGYALSMDNYTIVKDAPNLENAYLFIEYLLRSDVSKKITTEYPYINTTVASDLTDSEIENILSGGKYIKNIGEDIKKIDKLWAKIK